MKFLIENNKFSMLFLFDNKNGFKIDVYLVINLILFTKQL